MTEVGGLQDLAKSPDEAGADLTPPRRTRFGSAAIRRTITGLGIVSLAVPVVVYLWFIHRYGVNMLWDDQWADINVIGHAHAGNLSLATLWAQHFENRIFFPNLIVVVLGDTAHFNTVIEEYVSAAMLIIATGLLILTHRRRRPSTPWFYYCPVAILMFSLVGGRPGYGGGNTLSGFQMAWYLVLLGLAVTLFLLDRPSLTWLVLAGAMAAAVVGSFSSLQGLLIWPTGLVLLYLRRRSRRMMVAWIISAIVTGAIYFYNYNASAGFSRPSYLVTHPFGATSFFLFSVGNNITGQQVATPTHADLILGTLMVTVAVWLVIACGLRRDERGGNPLGVSLICFGLLFTAMITAGRAWLGYELAGRYAMFELLLWVGCYLALLERPIRGLRVTRAYLSGWIDNWMGVPPGRPIDDASAVGRSRKAPWAQMVTVAVQLVLVSIILVQAVLTTRSGITDASIWYQSQLVAADVTVNIDEAGDSLVQGLGSGAYSPGFIRQMTAIARSEHLSLFDTPLAAEDARRGLFPSIQSSVLVPAYGATVSGTQVLDAGVLVSTAGTRVQFRITGGLSHRALVLTAKLTLVGWIAYWDTTKVADGLYEVQSVLVYPDRSRAASAPISVTVENKRTT